MPAAIGQSNPNPLPVHGRYWFDARLYGVSPSSPDNGPALQKAVDAAKAAVVAGSTSSGAPTATVFIPAGAYTIKTPVFVDGSHIRLLGEGDCTQFAGPGLSASPLFCVGISSQGTPTPNPIGASYRPDAFGKLDASAAPAAGRRWGFSGGPAGDGYIICQASPFSHGPRGGADGVPTGWCDVSRLTIDFAVEGPASGQMPGGQSVLGLGNPTEVAYPFCVTTTGANTYQLNWSTQATKFGPIANHSVTFSTGAATGVQRISIQIDLVRGAIQAYAATGGATTATQLAVTGTMPAAGSVFNENLYFPFCVNYDNYDAHGIGSAPGGGQWSLYGLNISTGLRYADRGAGTAQVAHPQIAWPFAGATPSFALILPGAPTGGTYALTLNGQTVTLSPTATAAQLQAALRGIGLDVASVTGPTTMASSNCVNYQVALNSGTVTPASGMCDGSNLSGQSLVDVYRYFPAFSYTPGAIDYYTVAYLPFTEDPATAPRSIAIQGGWLLTGNVVGAALLINPGALGTTATGVRFEQMTMQPGHGSSYGMTVALGNVLDTSFERVTVFGGLLGIASHPFGANYTITLRDCTLGAGWAGLFLYWSDARLENIRLPVIYKAAIITVGSDVVTRDIFVGQYGPAPYAVVYAVGSEYGGTYVHEHTTCDFEGATTLQQGLFYFESAGFAPTSARVTDVYGGGIGYGPMIRLRSRMGAPVCAASYLLADNIQASTSGPIIDVDGALWHGEARNVVSASNAENNSVYVASSLAQGRPRVRVVDNCQSTFPRGGVDTWRRGTADVRIGSPADGQYARMALMADGTNGSTQPPRWAGLDALQSSPSALASYALDHSAISATLSGQASSQGFLADAAARALNQLLFGGSIPGTSAFLTLSGTGLGGTFKLSYGGQTTAGLAYNATAAQVQAALQGLSSVGAGNMVVSGNGGGPYWISLAGSLARVAGGINGLSVDGSGLSGTGASAAMSGSTLPQTWYAALLTQPGTRNGGAIFELSGGGYTRVPVANTTANFGTSSAGAKASGAAITFPAATASYSISGIALFPSASGGTPWAVINLASPLQVAVGQAPTIPAGALAFAHVPYSGHFAGCMTDYAWGKCYDLLFGAAPLAVPSTWYAALSTAAATRATTVPTEPSGGGYARAALPASYSTWLVGGDGLGGNDVYGRSGEARNASAIAFAAPSGAWGNLTAAALVDSSSGGAAWFVAPLVNPASPVAGSPAPTFAAGAFVLATA